MSGAGTRAGWQQAKGPCGPWARHAAAAAVAARRRLRRAQWHTRALPQSVQLGGGYAAATPAGACACSPCASAEVQRQLLQLPAHLLPGHGHVLQQLVHCMRHELERAQVHALVVPELARGHVAMVLRSGKRQSRQVVRVVGSWLMGRWIGARVGENIRQQPGR